MYEYFKRVVVTGANISTIYVHSWQPKGISNEKITTPNTSSSNDQAPLLECKDGRIGLLFKSDLLKQSRVTYNHGPKVSLFIVYKLNSHTANIDFTLRDCLFEAVKITKDKDLENYKYSGYGIGFDSRGTFSHSDGNNASNVIIFGANLSKSIHSNNKTENILILGKGLIEKLNGKTLYAEQRYPTNFTVTDKKFCLSLHYDGDISRLFVNAKKQVAFTAKDSEITPYKMSLGNISTDFSATNSQKTGLHGYVHFIFRL